MEGKIQRSKVGGAEWGLVIGALLFIDVCQKVLDFFVIGEVVNRFLDILIGGALLFYLAIRGELSNDETKKRVLMAFFATFLAEEIPILDIAVFWSIDGWYCKKQSQLVNQLADQQEKQQSEEAQQNKLQNQQDKFLKLQAIRQAQQE